METAEYWPMVHEYAIWNASIASLQFWAVDPNPVFLGIASECIYTTFFWTNNSHTLCQLPEDILFGCFVIALNAAFTQQLSFADEGYESGSGTMDLPTPLRKTLHILHISSLDHASFNPADTTHCRAVTSTPSRLSQMPTRPVHQHLLFNSDSDQEPDDTSMQTNSLDGDQNAVLVRTPESPDKEEDFPTVSIDGEHWTMDIVPERTFCIHENGLPNNVCQYPCPYGNSDII